MVVGSSVEAKDGKLVSSSVGSKKEIVEGLSVGDAVVGFSVGSAEGRSEGISVGEGSLVGGHEG